MKDLLAENLRLQAEVRALKDPPLSEEELDTAINGIQQFFATMNAARGAVTAANLYNKDYFAKIYDARFRKRLLAFLLEKFEKDQLMIEGTYNFWQALSEAQ